MRSDRSTADGAHPMQQESTAGHPWQIVSMEIILRFRLNTCDPRTLNEIRTSIRPASIAPPNRKLKCLHVISLRRS
jgi:hypothetical protein